MKCQSCSTEFVGRRCSQCGALPKEDEPVPKLSEIMASRKFQTRLWKVDRTRVSFQRDHVPWNEW